MADEDSDQATTAGGEQGEQGSTAGWDAIVAAMHQLHGQEEAAHWGTVLPASIGGQDPLHGISAYASDDEVPHWHYVSFGLTELFAKDSDDPEFSGFGFELTFRLVRGANEAAPPVWPASLLQNLARYVFQSGNVFSVGDHLNANGPICLDSNTALRALTFASDPGLPPQESPHGKFEFVQLVGITLEELEAIQTWNSNSFLELARTKSPNLLSDLDRDSWLLDPEFLRQVDAGRERDGSSCGLLFNPRFAFQESEGRMELVLGAKEVALVSKLLKGRLLHGHSLTLSGQDGAIEFSPGESFSSTITEGTLNITLTPADAEQVSQVLAPKAGSYQAAGLGWTVVKSEIRDRDGNLVESIG